ncbi:hypothetical protein PMAYCL1PPCAC_20221, partial [Pristionchus mayeri]
MKSLILILVVLHAGMAILRGSHVLRSKAPRWMASYHIDTQPHFYCSGTLIAPRIIHTSGNCLRNATKGNHFIVTINDFLLDTREKTEKRTTASDWYTTEIVRTAAREGKSNEHDKQEDYGLLFLDEAVSVCEEEKDETLLVPIIDSSIFPNETAALNPAVMMRSSITGWGLNERGRVETFLRSARPKNMYAVRGMIVVLEYANDARECNGDSGSPLVCRIENIPVIMGNFAGGIPIDEEAEMNEEEEWKKCELRRD